MSKTILYFHGFKSSSNSGKAQEFKSFVENHTSQTKILIPDLDDDFKQAIKQIKSLINEIDPNIFFMGSSLGGYYALYFAELYKTKSVLINPAIPPLNGFEEHLGKNENYATGNKFTISKNDISYIRSLHHKKILKPDNHLILLESEDEVLDYVETVRYFKGSAIDIFYGGNHSYSSINEKCNKIKDFLSLE
ncbi:esterase [Gammaproteobacteria bacterium]|nr:esterase [Gammaproteobacteria bacterium]